MDNSKNEKLQSAIKKKRLIYRLSAIAGVILLAVILFMIGKGHELTVENRSLNIQQTQYEAIQDVQLIINNQQKIPIRAGYQNQASVVGGRHRLKFEFLDDNKKIVHTIEKKINLGLNTHFLIRIPLLKADHPEWLTEKQEKPDKR